jgi:hypothetical protein
MKEFIKFLKEEVLVHTNVEIYSTFHVKEQIKIGTFKGTDLFFNHTLSSFGETPSLWVNYNEHKDDVWGTKFDFNYFSLSDKGISEIGKFRMSQFGDQEYGDDDLVLFDNWTDIIMNEIKAYDDLLDWCSKYVEAKKLSYKWSRWCHRANKDDNVEDAFTWEERLAIKRADIFLDELANRREKKSGESDLKKMLELGEENFDRVKREEAEKLRPIMAEMMKKFDWLNK